MRLLTMLATAVLLAGCVHDTDDFNLLLAERGASLTYYIGSGGGEAGLKEHDDPWGRLGELFPFASVRTGGGKSHDDPWSRILELKSAFRGHPRSNMIFVSFRGDAGKANDPWDVIMDKFPLELGKTVVVLRMKEVRGVIGRLELAGGEEIFAVGVPAEWGPGTVLKGEAFLLGAKEILELETRPGLTLQEQLRLRGVVVWEVQ